MKVIIYGGRDYPQTERWMTREQAIDHSKREIQRMFAYLDGHPMRSAFTEIVSGHAVGADKLGEIWATTRGFTPKIFKPDYNRFPSAIAPKKRNIEMGNYADMGIGFPGGGGTRHMTETLLVRKKPVYLAFEHGPLVS